MAQEFEASTYYNKSGWINPHLYNKLAIESFLENTLFVDKTSDSSRIIYSQDSIVFRKRIESLANGFDESTQVSLNTLDLPFASFYQTHIYEPDDREQSVTSTSMFEGYYDTETFNTLKFLAQKATYSVKLFYSRMDDAMQAHQILLWEQNPKSPILRYNLAPWYGINVIIPSNLTIENIDFNPSFNETKWLEQARIIPITFDIVVRTYSIMIEDNQSVPLPFKQRGLHSENYNKNVVYGDRPLTEKVTLNLLASKGFAPTQPKNQLASTSIKELINYSLIDNHLKNNLQQENHLSTDIIGSFYKESTGVSYNVCKLISKSPTSLQLNLKVKPADMKYFAKLEILIPGRETITITDCKTTGCLIEDLENNSEYNIVLLTYSVTGEIDTLKLKGRTLDSPTNEAPNSEAESNIDKKYPDILGFTW